MTACYSRSMKQKQKKFVKAYVREMGEKDGTLIGAIGSTADVDRYGEIIDQETWDLKNFKKNPVMLWAHNLTLGEDRPPIGKLTKVKVEDGKLVFDAQFDMADPFAADIYRKYKEGFLNAFSVGFIPHVIKRMDEKGEMLEHMVLQDNELLEMSAVPVPANAAALNALNQRSFQAKSWEKLLDDYHKKEDGDEEVTEPKEDSMSEEQENRIVEKVAEKILPTLTQAITGIAKDAGGKPPTDPPEPPEDTSGSSGSEPKTPQQGGMSPKLASLLRATTKSLQAVLTEYNAAARQ